MPPLVSFIMYSNVCKYLVHTSSVKATDLLSDSATSFINMEWACPVCILVDGLGVATSSMSNERLEADLWLYL